MCEQHAIGLANGLAASGLKPIAAIYSTFLQRAYDQVFHDVCLQKNCVVFALDRAGIVGNDGPTHNGVFDIAYLRHLPGIILMAPKDGMEFKAMIRKATQVSSPVAIRYPRANVPEEKLEKNYDSIDIGKGEILRQGQDGAIIAYGAMVSPSIKCADLLAEKGIDITVVNARFAKPLDEDLTIETVKEHQIVFTVEDHSIVGGFSSAIQELLADKNVNAQGVHRLGIPDKFMEHGSRDEILKSIGLDAEGIYKSFISVWDKLGPTVNKSEEEYKRTPNLV
jgi:1-deoxy-D-xylulose-5-phosphate synthase